MLDTAACVKLVGEQPLQTRRQAGAASNGKPAIDEPVSMGTTIIGFKYNNGVILAADSRTSTFPVVANPFARKLNPITENIWLARAGAASHTQYCQRMMQHYAAFHQVDQTSCGAAKLEKASVKSVASIARLMHYNNRDYLKMGFIVGGVDDVDGPQLYAIPAGGAIFTREIVSAGSGSVHIDGLIDATFKPNMDKETAVKYAVNLVNHAMMRDAASGGIVRYVVIDRDSGTEAMYVDARALRKVEDVAA